MLFTHHLNQNLTHSIFQAMVRLLLALVIYVVDLLVVGLVAISIKCLSVSSGLNTDLQIATVMEELDELKKKADDLVARGGFEVVRVMKM